MPRKPSVQKPRFKTYCVVEETRFKHTNSNSISGYPLVPGTRLVASQTCSRSTWCSYDTNTLWQCEMLACVVSATTHHYVEESPIVPFPSLWGTSSNQLCSPPQVWVPASWGPSVLGFNHSTLASLSPALFLHLLPYCAASVSPFPFSCTELAILYGKLPLFKELWGVCLQLDPE